MGYRQGLTLARSARKDRSKDRVRVFVVIFCLALASAITYAPKASANARVAFLDAREKVQSSTVSAHSSQCFADVSGDWSGVLTFGVLDSRGMSQKMLARSTVDGSLNAATPVNGVFVWSLPARAKACLIAMTEYFAGLARVSVGSLSESLPASSPLDPPNYVTWYTVPPTATPTPITGAFVSIGEALGAGNIYNTGGTSGFGELSSGECLFICYGAPGIASSNVLAAGNDVNNLTHSFTVLGAPDDCTLAGPITCPGGIADQIFAVEEYGSPEATPTVLVAIDKNANFAAYSNIYAGGAVIAGAGVGTSEPSPSAGSLVSYTGTTPSPDTGDILLGSASDFVKCDYGETTF